MTRPFTVCHLLSSIDGRISGPFFAAPEREPAQKAYGAIREQYNCPSALYGSTTMAQTYAAGFVSDLPKACKTYPRTDYIAPSDVDRYYISVDINGTIAWENKYIEKKGRPKAHAVTILTENISDDYLEYLHSFDISYIFAGENDLDCALALHKLHTLLGIERLVIAGGGVVDYTFLQAGLVDEVSVVLAPLTDGRRNTATIFDEAPFTEGLPPVAFTLLEVRAMEGNAVWLRYKPKNTL